MYHHCQYLENEQWKVKLKITCLRIFLAFTSLQHPIKTSVAGCSLFLDQFHFWRLSVISTFGIRFNVLFLKNTFISHLFAAMACSTQHCTTVNCSLRRHINTTSNMIWYLPWHSYSSAYFSRVNLHILDKHIIIILVYRSQCPEILPTYR